MPNRRFPPPWSVEDTGATFIVKDTMGRLHRVINLIVALILVAIGGGGVVYFYFIDTTWPLWITIVSGIVGASGLYWLWEEYVNVGQQPRD